MIKFETKRYWLKIGCAVAVFILPIALALVAPSLGIQEGGKISLGRMQVVYAVCSLEIAAAVYIWGVGNWSRYEPPHSSDPQASGPAMAPKSGPPPPAPSNAGPSAQPPGEAPAAQGEH